MHICGYSWTRKSYRCYNLRLNKIVERIDVTFDEHSLLKTKREKKKPNMPNDEMNIELRQEEEDEEDKQDENQLEEGNNQQFP